MSTPHHDSRMIRAKNISDQVAADGEELQAVQPLGDAADKAGDRRVDQLPDRSSSSSVKRAGRCPPAAASRPVSRARNDGGAEDAAQRLGEARRRCIASAGGIGEAAIPGAGRAAVLRREAVDHEPPPGRQDQRWSANTSSRRRCCAPARRHEREPRRMAAGIGSPRPPAAADRRDRIDHDGRQQAAQMHRTKPAHRGQRSPVTSRASAAAVRARAAEERRCRRRGRSRRPRGPPTAPASRRSRRRELQRRLRQRWAVEHGLEQQPLRDEAVERRQGRDRERAHQEEQRRARHAMDQPAQPVEIAPPRGVQDGAGAEEQQDLEQAWLSTWSSAAVIATAAAHSIAVGAERQRQAQRRRRSRRYSRSSIGQHALQVVLHQRIEHAEHGGHARRDQRAAAPTTRPAGRADRTRCGRSRRSRPWS